MNYEVNQKAREALNRLASLPGMQNVKQQVEQMVSFARISKLRERQGLKSKSQTNHMLFTGNPGTGKTTAARLIGEAFAAIGLLKTSGDNIPFVEIHHADVTHPHVGQAERTIKNKFKEARGGVMFIDEAYAFIDGTSDHRSDDKVVAAIVQLMEDMRDEIVVIAAGYPGDMEDFLKSNPGLPSRFASTIHFPDYSVPDLVLIAQQMITEQDFQATPDYLEALASVLWIEKSRPFFGNARTVRNHIERSIRRQAVRIANIPRPTREDLFQLKSVDLVHSVSDVKRTEKEVLKKLITDTQQRLLELEIREITQNTRS